MKKITVFISILFVVLFSYWLKNQININLFSSLTLSSYFPFNLLQSEQLIIPADKKGIIFSDSFESLSGELNWETIWHQKNGSVTREYDTNFTNRSQCLLIKNFGETGWAYQSAPLIEVRNKDKIRISGLIKKSNKNTNPQICLNIYDKNKDILEWNYKRITINKANEWIFKEEQILIPDSVYYIKLRLVGYKAGFSWFDEIKLFRFP